MQNKSKQTTGRQQQQQQQQQETQQIESWWSGISSLERTCSLMVDVEDVIHQLEAADTDVLPSGLTGLNTLLPQLTHTSSSAFHQGSRPWLGLQCLHTKQ